VNPTPMHQPCTTLEASTHTWRATADWMPLPGPDEGLGGRLTEIVSG